MTFKDYAKTELHCHLDGSLPLDAIRQLGEWAEIDFPADDAELLALVSAPEETESLLDYLKPFDVIRPLLQTKKALTYAAYAVAKAQAEENVIYSEIRFAPELSMDEGLSAYEVTLAVLEGLQQAQEEFGIVAKALVCGMRHSPKEVTEPIFEAVVELAGKGFVGFDFAGDEANYPPEKLEAIITSAKELGLPFTFHAGECNCAENVDKAVDLGMKRIGHATAVYNRPDIIKKMKEKDVVAELCLTSNLQTKAAHDLSEFPYRPLREAGVKISINTDNRTVSQTNLTKEYERFHEDFDLTADDFYRHNQEAIAGSFASSSEKSALQEKLTLSYKVYL